jgi:hypothetical protein
VQVVDASGKPVSAAQVHVAMKKHDFCSVPPSPCALVGTDMSEVDQNQLSPENLEHF